MSPLDHSLALRVVGTGYNAIDAELILKVDQETAVLWATVY
jgi:hypothetical protein